MEEERNMVYSRCYGTRCANNMNSKQRAQEILSAAGVTVSGPNPWDPRVHDERLYDRLFAEGTVAVGESYMDGWWDVEDLAEMIARVMRSNATAAFFSMPMRQAIPLFLKSRVFNLQNTARAFQVGEKHYDIGNNLYERLLDPSMTYTCGYWKDAKSLEEAQRAKLDLI